MAASGAVAITSPAGSRSPHHEAPEELVSCTLLNAPPYEMHGRAQRRHLQDRASECAHLVAELHSAEREAKRAATSIETIEAGLASHHQISETDRMVLQESLDGAKRLLEVEQSQGTLLQAKLTDALVVGGGLAPLPCWSFGTNWW